MNLSSLYTLDASNAGIELPIPLPNGKPSGYTFHVLGADSDVFRKARAARVRKGPAIMAMPDDVRDEAIRKADIELLATVVVGWTFPDVHSRELVEEVFTKAPHVFDIVNEAVAERGRFFDVKLIACSPTPKENSN